MSSSSTMTQPMEESIGLQVIQHQLKLMQRSLSVMLCLMQVSSVFGILNLMQVLTLTNNVLSQVFTTQVVLIGKQLIVQSMVFGHQLVLTMRQLTSITNVYSTHSIHLLVQVGITLKKRKQRRRNMEFLKRL